MAIDFPAAPEALPARFNLSAALLDRRLEQGDGDRVAIEHLGRSWTYADISALTARAGHALIDSAPTTLEPADTHRDEAAFWLWTSGSTGTPKAAIHLHQHPIWCARRYGQEVIGVHAGDRAFSAAKLFHAYGLGNSLFFPFWTGATSILFPGRALPEDVYSVIDRDRPTIFFGVDRKSVV